LFSEREAALSDSLTLPGFLLMSYHLLTGATGLLGTYLLRDGLAAGRRLVVVVRRSNMEPARQRIESVLARCEGEMGRALPRPPVLEGDICRPDLGMDRASLDWVARHCVGVLHNAASLSFAANERTGEPRRSNVEGTRNVLELCRKTGIRQFHHVSTAYVCGLRTGRVLESELDVGQEWGNEYEQSKVEGEKLVRAADFLDPPTIYRPAIIIGDSASGYTATFHGFYTPLKIGQALVDQFKPESIDGAPLVAVLGLTGDERKNFVPVDWVSRVITYLHGHPEHHGQTYHLAPSERVPVTTCREVIEKALDEYARQHHDRNHVTSELAEMQETFVEQMGAYRAYWRDDPQFDMTSTLRAAPHLAACRIDSEMLLRAARYALECNFGWPRPKPVCPRFDVAEHLGRIVPVAFSSNGAAEAKIGLQVNGTGGGQWTLMVNGRRAVSARPGLADGLAGLVYLNSTTFEECASGRLTPKDAVGRGLVAAEAGEMSAEGLLEVFEGCLSAR
jgi:thioester reductase-like protein